jgi:uncharacterized membrane protein
VVRHLSLDTDVRRRLGRAMLAGEPSGDVVARRGARRQRVAWPARPVARWLLPGTFVGFSYAALFEAFYRGIVSVVAPIVATESLFGVAFSAWFLGQSEG